MLDIKDIIGWIIEIILVGFIIYFFTLLYPLLKEVTGVSIFGL